MTIDYKNGFVSEEINQSDVFFAALKLPGVVDFAIHLFFVKLGIVDSQQMYSIANGKNGRK